MTTLELLQPVARRFDAPARRAPVNGGRVTLQERLDLAWRSVTAHGETDCPLCHAPMAMRAGEAECGGCGTRLS